MLFPELLGSYACLGSINRCDCYVTDVQDDHWFDFPDDAYASELQSVQHFMSAIKKKHLFGIGK